MKNLKTILEENENKFENYEPAAEAKDSSYQKDYTKEEKVPKKANRALYLAAAIFACLSIIAILLYAVSFLPYFGTAENNPAFNEILERYIQHAIGEDGDTGAVNFVTGMILDYRAFDTLGESFVLFTAVNIVLILLANFKDKHTESQFYHISDDKIVRSAASFLVPLILLFGAYVILNGSISPGGGFSGGAIMGAGLILYALSFGFDKSHQFFKDKTFKTISSIALLTYCLCKTYSFFTGANEIESIVPKGVEGAILSGGLIFVLNVCVGLVVTCTMFGFYSLFKKGEI